MILYLLKVMSRAKSWVWIVLFMAGVFVSCRSVDYGTVSGYAMEPAFYEGDYIFVEDVEAADLERGEVVALQLGSGYFLLRRIIALPGEVIEIRDGLIYIEGVLYEEPYTATVPEDLARMELAADSYYVLGDNRAESEDSADFGPITADQIMGRVEEP